MNAVGEHGPTSPCNSDVKHYACEGEPQILLLSRCGLVWWLVVRAGLNGMLGRGSTEPSSDGSAWREAGGAAAGIPFAGRFAVGPDRSPAGVRQMSDLGDGWMA